MFKTTKQIFQVLSGKKKVLSSNPHMSGMIAIEVAMFESWYTKTHHKMLPENEMLTIIYNILHREKLLFTEAEARGIQNIVLVGFPQEKIKQMREQNNFDIQVKSFCQSINCEHLL